MDKMRAVTPKSRRRATVLLMVVSLLALLFVLVTGFLSLSRSESQLGRDISESDLVETLVEDIDEWAIKLIKDQIVDDEGEVLPGGDGENFSWEDIPGYRHTSYLAALEPVWNPAPDYSGTYGFENSGSWQVLVTLRWPAVTSLDDEITSPQPFPLYQLMRDYHLGEDDNNEYFQREDAKWNARNPFMDADGDGVPDSQFLFCAPATEALNTAAGTPISLPRFDPNYPEDPSENLLTWCLPELDENNGTVYDEIWHRYDEQARYEVAVRIISHGGMATLSSPTLRDASDNGYLPFNRSFVIDLFDSIREGSQSMRVQYEDLYEQNRLFDELEASAGAVEASLRRRFTLASPTDETYHSDVYTRVPAILAELQGESDDFAGFGAFWPQFKTPCQVGEEGYQRINIGVDSGSGDERQGWGSVVARNPTEYNLNPTNSQPVVSYNQRHFITAVNYSDDLARKQESGEPEPTLADPLASSGGTTFVGEQKLYLGEVSKAFVEIGATGSGQYAYDYRRGSLIIQRLARLYYDMLASYGDSEDWGAAFSANDIDSDKEVVSRRQQAFMLAVNTVAFAAPRDSEDSTERGWIDTVSYVDEYTGAVATEYVGYAPQPFFSEAIAYNKEEEDPEDPEHPDDLLAIAVELYNPNDLEPGFDVDEPGDDPFALYLPQFAISVGGANPNSPLTAANTWAVLGDGDNGFESPYMSGRSFTTFVIKDSGATETNDDFDTYVGERVFVLDIQEPDEEDNGRVELELWRQGRYYDTETETAVTRWFQVDCIHVYYPDSEEWASRYRDLAKATSDTTTSHTFAGEPYFGVVSDDGTENEKRWARWSVVCAWDDDDTLDGTGNSIQNEAGPNDGPLSDAALLEVLGEGRGDPRQFKQNQAGGNGEEEAQLPIIPLITMNAGPDTDSDASGMLLHERLNRLPMFGDENDLRPNSFPTVGFMLFLPRYSHAQQLTLPSDWVFPMDEDDNVEPGARRSMSQTLEKERYCKGYDGNTPWNVLADFGHMPIFDNNLDAEEDSYFDEVGTLPWGLLVFDYFTTIDPTRDVNEDGKPDVDPCKIPGRVNINVAPWPVLADLPLIGPDENYELPIRASSDQAGDVGIPEDPSPAFWHWNVAVLSGVVDYAGVEQDRLLAIDREYEHEGYDVPHCWRDGEQAVDSSVGRYRLGPWLAQAAAAYRDGVQYVVDPVNYSITTYQFSAYADSHLRGGVGAKYGPNGTVDAVAYRPLMYGSDDSGGIRGAAQVDAGKTFDVPDHYGFLSVGELANVKGFDSSWHTELPNSAGGGDLSWTALGRGDFVKAVSLLALLDSQYLTTRSNTFTIYASVMDREERENSVRSQVTVDRSNLLPRLTYVFDDYDLDTHTHTYYTLEGDNLTDSDINVLPVVPMLLDLDDDSYNVPESPVRTTNADATPQVIAEEQVGYFNINHDD